MWYWQRFLSMEISLSKTFSQPTELVLELVLDLSKAEINSTKIADRQEAQTHLFKIYQFLKNVLEFRLSNSELLDTDHVPLPRQNSLPVSEAAASEAVLSSNCGVGGIVYMLLTRLVTRRFTSLIIHSGSRTPRDSLVSLVRQKIGTDH